MGAQLGGKKGFVAEINVTPFVDVMLVLLIIFMVTAPMMTEGMEVNLPKTEAIDSLPTEDATVILTLKADGTVFMNELQTPVDTLAAQLVNSVKNQKKKLFLKADKDVPYGHVVSLMGRIRAAGIEQIGIVAERVEDILPLDAQPEPAAGAGRVR